MNNKVKFILTFVCGIIVGVLLTFVVSTAIYVHNKQSTPTSDPDVTLFEKPQQTIDETEFRIIQVLDNGNALATEESVKNTGTVILFLAKDNNSYYDNQRITVSSGKIAKQIGTYKYETNQHMIKTVPVVDFFDE